MIRIIKFKTFDGREFASKEDACEHDNKMYTDVICRLSSNIASLNKYQAIKEYIDTHLEEFGKALAIRHDMRLADDMDCE